MGQCWDIAIVGGGPAGATAGALLAAAGFGVVVCEGKRFPREKVCGEFMSAKVRPILRRMGLLEIYDRAAGPAIRRVAACAPGAAEAVFGSIPADSDGAFPRSLRRGELDQMLLGRAAAFGAKVLQPCHVLGVKGNAAEGFLVETNCGEIRARAVVLAHGLAQRGGMGEGEAAPRLVRNYLNFKAHFAGCDLPAETIAIAGGEGIYAGLVRTSGGCGWLDASTKRIDGLPIEGSPSITPGGGCATYSLAFVVRRDRVARLGNSAERHFAQLVLENRAFGRFVNSGRRLAAWMASGPLEPGVRRVYSDGRFFVGNAAGEVHALVGEGITLAMQGAEILADTLQRFGLGRIDDAGRAYEAGWRGQFARRYGIAQGVANLMMRPWLADLGAQVCAAFPEVLPAAVRWSGK